MQHRAQIDNGASDCFWSVNISQQLSQWGASLRIATQLDLLVWIGALIQWVRGGGTIEVVEGSPCGKSAWCGAAYFCAAVEVPDLESRRTILCFFSTNVLQPSLTTTFSAAQMANYVLCITLCGWIFFHLVIDCFLVHPPPPALPPNLHFPIVSPVDLNCWCLCLLQDENDNPPEFSKLSYIVKIPENVIAGESL